MTEHLDDGEFIRLLDGEVRAEEREALEQHSTACPACAARLAELRRTSRALTAALTSADLEPRAFVPRRVPRRFWRHPAPALSAAAIVLCFVAAIAVAQPVRTWLRVRWDELRGAAPKEESSAPQASRVTTVRFVPRASLFTIELAAAQASGVLTVDVTDDTIATAALSGGNGEELVVLPVGLRIVNQASTVASYDVRLPRGVREVVVQVGKGPTRRLARLGDRRWTVDLHSTSLEPH